MADLDWAEMEGLFCQQGPPIVPTTTVTASCGQGIETERRRREPTEVIFLLHLLIINLFFDTNNKSMFLDIPVGWQTKFEC